MQKKFIDAILSFIALPSSPRLHVSTSPRPLLGPGRRVEAHLRTHTRRGLLRDDSHHLRRHRLGVEEVPARRQQLLVPAEELEEVVFLRLRRTPVLAREALAEAPVEVLVKGDVLGLLRLAQLLDG